YKTNKAWLSVRDLAVVYMRRILGIRNEGVVGALNKVGVRSYEKMDEVYARTGESTDGKTDSATSCVILELNRQSRPPTKLEIVEVARENSVR
ncbi:hypothetical protein AFLA70_87g002660, partial [Aspergillus flavus AF70]